MADCNVKEIVELLKNSRGVSIFTHMRPDGDALGSALALSAALNTCGVANVVLDESDVPSKFSFMDGVENIKKQSDFSSDVFVAVDSADEQRLGMLADVFVAGKRKKITINIDHHVSNTHYAQYNFVRACSANCMNIMLVVEAMGVPFDKKIANLLMTGILTDSGNFSHDDVCEETFLAAARLVSRGADVKTLNEILFKRQSKARADLYARVISGIRYAENERFAVLSVTQETMRLCGADASMTEGFVDFPLTVDTVEVSASLMEVKKGQYKVSLRSKNYADVNKIAGVYGGGGHVRAAGCMIFGDLEDVIDRLTYTVSQYLE